MSKLTPGVRKVVTVTYLSTINGRATQPSLYHGARAYALREARDTALRRAGKVVCECGRIIADQPGSREMKLVSMIKALLHALPKRWDGRISEPTHALIDEAGNLVRELEANAEGHRA